MQFITIDFETYYSREFSLSKITTEEYVRSDQFEVIGVGVKVNDEEAQWFSGTHDSIQKFLLDFDWSKSVAIAHNAPFDAAILGWRFGIHPFMWVDTLAIARAVGGIEQGNSLKKLAERFNLGVKGTEVLDALGKKLKDFSPQDLAQYGEYCKNDVELTFKLFNLYLPQVSQSELQIINITTKMFSEPVLELDIELLEQHLEAVQDRKTKLLEAAEADRDTLMSNDKFAELLKSIGVDPPRKISPATGRETWAFAKTDEGFKALLEHEDETVQTLAAARLGTKSTLEETRTQRFINIAKRGNLPVPLRYYAAHTGRWGGDDKLNLQNLPSRGTNTLKNAIIAPDGYVIIDSDSSQIEARVLAWLSGQNDLVRAFANGEDVYRIMASAIYNKPEDEITKEERFVGKTTILGCIAEGTLVLSNRGWVAIEDITLEDRLWDGEEWVCHQGLVKKGIKETLSLSGLWLTPDHKVLCGTHWLEAQSVAQDKNILSLALDTGVVTWLSPDMSKVPGVGSAHLLSNAIAGDRNIQSIGATLEYLKAHDAPYAAGAKAIESVIGNIFPYYLTPNIESDYSIGFLPPSHVATYLPTKHLKITEVGGLPYAKNGEITAPSSLSMFKHLMVGITQSLIWTVQTITKGTNRETYGLCPEQTTTPTVEKSVSCRRSLMTYDIACAGPRNRFTVATNAGPIIVHNCGYGMGAEKFKVQLKNFGIDTPLEECQRIITVYRQTYPRIPELWRQAGKCLDAMLQCSAAPIGVQPQALYMDDKGFRLPNGFHIKYNDLRHEVEGYTYKARNGRTKVYGGKVVENLCQALARCVIAEQMIDISKKYRVVLTVHDAVACVAKEEEAEEAKKYIEKCMRHTPEWAAGLPLNCEAGYAKSYGEC